MTAINRRQAYEIVDRFEAALCQYTGAPICVATDSCTNALFISLFWHRNSDEMYRAATELDITMPIKIPKWNYVGVYHAATNAGYKVEWTDEKWEGDFRLGVTDVVDSAKRFERGMYQPGTLTCVSFGSSKRLPIGKGGAILLDDQEAADWIRPRTMDGRTPGEDYKTPHFVTPAWRINMTPDMAARGLDLLTYIDDNDQANWTEYPNLAEATWD